MLIVEFYSEGTLLPVSHRTRSNFCWIVSHHCCVNDNVGSHLAFIPQRFERSALIANDFRFVKGEVVVGGVSNHQVLAAL